MEEQKTENKSSSDTVGTEKNRDHLYKPGQSGNPKGRPKGSVSIVQAIKKKLEEEHPDSTPEVKKLWLDMVVEKIFAKGLEGDVSMLKDMTDRVDGKSKESHEHTGKLELVLNLSKDIADKNGVAHKASTDSEGQS